MAQVEVSEQEHYPIIKYSDHCRAKCFLSSVAFGSEATTKLSMISSCFLAKHRRRRRATSPLGVVRSKEDGFDRYRYLDDRQPFEPYGKKVGSILPLHSGPIVEMIKAQHEIRHHDFGR
jgi:hypothetical protein